MEQRGFEDLYSSTERCNDDFKKFQIETREKMKDRMAIMKKQMPDVDFEASELSEMFIEIFE